MPLNAPRIKFNTSSKNTKQNSKKTPKPQGYLHIRAPPQRSLMQNLVRTQIEVHLASWWLGDKQILHNVWTRFTVPRHSAPGPTCPHGLLPALHAKHKGLPL